MIHPTVLSYTNPVYPGYFADPFVFRHANDYYAIGTGPTDHGIFPLLHSRNLVEWTSLGAAMIPPDPALGTDFWAPEIVEHQGTFYLYYSVGFGDKGHRIRVATATKPEGPYQDRGVNLLDPEEVPFCIDAHPFQDDNGDWYLFYARDFLDSENGQRAGTALVVDRLLDMTRLGGGEKLVMRANSDWQRYMADRPMYGGVYDWHTLEGPTVCKHGDRYYMFYSGGRWENDTYGVDYAEAPHPLGPWTAVETPAARVLRTVPNHVLGPGHNSRIVGPDGGDFLVYHAWDPKMTARRMCIDRLEWTDDGPRCLGPTWTPQII